MRYIKQFGIILIITFLGEVMRAVLPLPIPASIYGLVLMLGALCTKAVKLDSVNDVGVFLIEIMPILFIPPAVGLMASWETLKPIFVPVIFIVVATTILVMAATGGVTQLLLNLGKVKAKSGKDNL